jgi:hypothetical protein
MTLTINWEKTMKFSTFNWIFFSVVGFFVGLALLILVTSNVPWYFYLIFTVVSLVFLIPLYDILLNALISLKILPHPSEWFKD